MGENGVPIIERQAWSMKHYKNILFFLHLKIKNKQIFFY